MVSRRAPDAKLVRPGVSRLRLDAQLSDPAHFEALLPGSPSRSHVPEIAQHTGETASYSNLAHPVQRWRARGVVRRVHPRYRDQVRAALDDFNAPDRHKH